MRLMLRSGALRSTDSELVQACIKGLTSLFALHNNRLAVRADARTQSKERHAMKEINDIMPDGKYVHHHHCILPPLPSPSLYFPSLSFLFLIFKHCLSSIDCALPHASHHYYSTHLICIIHDLSCLNRDHSLYDISPLLTPPLSSHPSSRLYSNFLHFLLPTLHPLS